MTGAANKVQFHLITPGAPDSIVATPTFVCTQIISTQTDGLIAKKTPVVYTFEIDQFDDVILTAFGTLVSPVEPSTTQAENYENSVVSTQGVAGSGSTAIRSVMIKYGGDLSGTKIHVALAAGMITNDSWSHTTKFEEVIKPNLVYSTIKQAAGNAITIPAGVWDAAIVQTTAPTPALPTTIAANTAGSDYGLQKA